MSAPTVPPPSTSAAASGATGSAVGASDGDDDTAPVNEGAEIPFSPGTPGTETNNIWEASFTGDMRTLRALVRHGFSVNRENPVRTP